jgi:argininosuccinate synthase
MNFLMAANQTLLSAINGSVTLGLYKGNVIIKGRSSNNSLYNHDIASMDKLGDYDQTDAKGFIKLTALRLKSTQA